MNRRVSIDAASRAMTPGRRTRSRGLIAIAGAVGLAIGGLGLTTPRAATAARPMASPAGQPTIMNEGPYQMEVLPTSGKPPTWAEISRVYKMVDAAVKATAKYRDFAAATRDHYTTVPILFLEHQGYHYYQPQYLLQAAAGIFDVTRPPFLVYNKVNGVMTLSGLMYYVPRRFTPQQLDAIFPLSMATWHRHINNCLGTKNGSHPTEASGADAIALPYHDAATCSAKGGVFIKSSGWMAHTWIGKGTGITGLFDMDMASSGHPMPGM